MRIAAAAAAALILWCVVYAPPDLEELVPVHLIACSYEHASLNTFEGPCGGHDDLIDFGFFHYQRAYTYEGAASSALYFPLWKIWKSLYSFYLLGVICFLLFSCGLAWAAGLDLRYAVIPLAYFPFAYLFVHDTGPVRIAMLSLPALALLTRGALGDRARSHQLAYGVLAGLIVVVCVEDKPFYAFVAPTIALCIAALVDGRGALGNARVGLMAFTATAAAGLGVLLFAGHVDGTTYFTFLRQLASRPHEFTLQVKYLFQHTFLVPVYAARVFGWDPRLRLLSFLWPLALGPLAFVLWRAGSVDRQTIGWLAAAYAAGAIIALATRVEYQGHHYVFLHLPFVLLLMFAASRTPVGRTAALTYVTASAVLAMGILTWHSVPPWYGERPRVLAYLSRHDVESAHVVNMMTWAGYHELATYGDPGQLVTSVDTESPAALARLNAAARSLSRSIINVCVDCSRSSVEAVFPGADIKEIDLGLTHWRLFEVLQPTR